MRNLVDNMHYNLIAWLVDTFKVILISRFGVPRMVKNKGRFIRAKTVRGMYSVQLAALQLPAAGTGQGRAGAWVHRHRV